MRDIYERENVSEQRKFSVAAWESALHGRMGATHVCFAGDKKRDLPVHPSPRPPAPRGSSAAAAPDSRGRTGQQGAGECTRTGDGTQHTLKETFCKSTANCLSIRVTGLYYKKNTGGGLFKGGNCVTSRRVGNRARGGTGGRIANTSMGS